MSVDVQRITDCCIGLHQLWSLPFQIGVSLYLLYTVLGWALVAGVMVMCFVILCNMFITKQISFVAQGLMQSRDDRVDVISSILKNILQLKLLNWENLYNVVTPVLIIPGY